MNADSLKLKSDGSLRQHRCIGRAFRFLMARPCPGLDRSGDRVGVPGVNDVLFHQATAPHTLVGMCKRTRLYLAHDVNVQFRQHFRRANALVHTRTLNRAASRRPMVRLLSAVITQRRPALIPIVPYSCGTARVGISPITYVSRRREYPTH